jgi:hypothetical protein
VFDQKRSKNARNGKKTARACCTAKSCNTEIQTQMLKTAKNSTTRSAFFFGSKERYFKKCLGKQEDFLDAEFPQSVGSPRSIRALLWPEPPVDGRHQA